MSNLTKEYLQEVLHYDPDTGLFAWKKSPCNRIPIGSIAGGNDGRGYIRIEINKKRYKAHHLAWFYVFGWWPQKYIDHINRIGTNNRINNLREATLTENIHNQGMRRNNTSGVKGVHWNKQMNKWMANCRVNRKQHHLGYFTDIYEAESVVRKFRENKHGEFANHGCSDADKGMASQKRELK